MGAFMGRSERISNRKLRGIGWAPRYPSMREGLRATAAELGVARTTGRAAA
jgi:hypothetical protein